MLTALIVSNILSWLVILGLGITIFALLRQVGLLHERMGPVGALTVAKGAKPGDELPSLILPSLTGGDVITGGPAQAATLYFFLSPDCPVCKSLLPVIGSIREREKDWLRVVLASDGDGDHAGYITRQKLDSYPYIVSSDLGLAIGVSKLPYAALIDKDGKIVAHGLTNTREHIESLFEAKRTGTASIQDYMEQEQRRA